MENSNTSDIYNQQNNQHYPDAGQQMFEDENSSFDIVRFLMKFVRFWYLFVISVLIFYGIAKLQNRSWQPVYKSSALVIIEEGNKYGGMNQNLMQGFGVQQGYRNVNNQVIMFSSYDLIAKVVDRLPLVVEYYNRGRFRTNSLYKISPVNIEYDFISPEAYSYEFSIKDKGNNKYTITYSSNDTKKYIEGVYGKPLRNSLFFITVEKTVDYKKGFECYFKFNNRETLIAGYDSKLSLDFAMEGSSVITVSVTGPVVQRDTEFLDALCEAFIEDNLARKNEVATKTIDFIEQQLLEIADSVTISEGRLKSYRIENQILNVGSFSSQIMAQSNKMTFDNSAFKLKESYLNYLVEYFEKNIQDETIVAPSSIGVTDPVLMQLVSQFNTIYQQRKDIGPKNPYYAKYSSQLETTKDMMLEVLRNLRRAFEIEKQDLVQRESSIEERISRLPNQESQMSKYERKFKIHDNYYTFLLQKRAESQIQKASNSPDNIILDKARMVSVINGGVKSSTYSFYLFLGFLLPIAFILIKDLFNNKVFDNKDIEKVSPFPYLGAVRHTNVIDPVAVQKNPRSGFAESYRVIRTRIEFLVQRQSPVSLLVTSTESGDGKTAFSLNMAGMYSLTGRKTIIVDFDLRKPSVGLRMGISKTQLGISNYLIGQVEELDDIIIKDTKYKFDVLLGGTVPPNPGELIRSNKLLDVYNYLQRNYEHIIIDTSPIGLVADAYAIMKLVDATMFLVRSEKTHKVFFKNIIQQLKSDKKENVYVVLNDVDEKKAGYSNYHEYGRRSYYMKKDDYYSYAKDYFDTSDLELVGKKRLFRKKKKKR